MRSRWSEQRAAARVPRIAFGAVLLATADVQEMGGKRGEDDDLRAGLQGTPNHPDRLLVGGLLGPRRGGLATATE